MDASVRETRVKCEAYSSSFQASGTENNPQEEGISPEDLSEASSQSSSYLAWDRAGSLSPRSPHWVLGGDATVVMSPLTKVV